MVPCLGHKYLISLNLNSDKTLELICSIIDGKKNVLKVNACSKRMLKPLAKNACSKRILRRMIKTHIQNAC
jgi:hypothetical protein